jgi:predicted adenine nucleotide alpha hydrolase (AANH) superfamily ATPase
MILLHICCGPCAAYPTSIMHDEGLKVRGYFYNPNIHPYREFRLRLQSVRTVADNRHLTVEYHSDYGLQEYLRQVVFHEQQRCGICYEMRLAATARQAKALGAEAFSTTLLYSRYQNHELIREKGDLIAGRFAIPFYYRDFREGWQAGREMAVDMGLYRQSYCGCIYSEQERYDKKLRRKRQGITPMPGRSRGGHSSDIDP